MRLNDSNSCQSSRRRIVGSIESIGPDRWPSIEQFYRTMRPTRMLNDISMGFRTVPNLPRAQSSPSIREHHRFAVTNFNEAIELVQNEEHGVQFELNIRGEDWRI